MFREDIFVQGKSWTVCCDFTIGSEETRDVPQDTPTKITEALVEIEKMSVLRDPSRDKMTLDQLLTPNVGESDNTFELRNKYARRAMETVNIRPTMAVLLGQLASNRTMLGSTYDPKITQALDTVDEYINESS